MLNKLNTIICLDLIAVNKKIEKEVADYERKYRGRELPGFINYKTFEVMVKDQIKQLEEPAVKKLKDISGAVYVLSVCRPSTFWDPTQRSHGAVRQPVWLMCENISNI